MPTVKEAELAVDALLSPPVPPRTPAEEGATRRAEQRLDEMLADHRRWQADDEWSRNQRTAAEIMNGS